MKAVVYGAGNIGRGFVGALFSQSGYRVTFIDVDRAVVERLARDGRYPIRVVSEEGGEDLMISGVDAVDGRDGEAVVRAIHGADLMATAVGAKVLPLIAPLIAAGLRSRFETGRPPLNILLCENLNDVNRVMEDLLLEQLQPLGRGLLRERVGLVETSIGRMVPVQTPRMKGDEPLRVCVERYGFLPVDKDAFLGEIPRVANMIPYSPFDFYLKRKLFVHNMGHAACAYLGLYTGREEIWEAVGDPLIALTVQNAMQESAVALAGRYGADLPEILLHVQDLLYRFGNRALGDTCARVAADPARKLSPTDRLVGAAALCLEQGVPPVFISLAAAAALCFLLRETGSEATPEAAARALHEQGGLAPGEEPGATVLQFAQLFLTQTPLDRIFARAVRLGRERRGDIV